MPAEPDNGKIEELLKAYARKRREEAANGGELHPAVRKMLQTEVARQKPATTAGGTRSVASLLRFWPRIAFAAAAALVLSLVLWNVARVSNRRSEVRMAKAMDTDTDGKALGFVPAPKDAAEKETLRSELAPTAPVSAPSPVTSFADSDAAAPRASAPVARKVQQDFEVTQRRAQGAPAEVDAVSREKAPAETRVMEEKLAELKLRDESLSSRKRADGTELAVQPRPSQTSALSASSAGQQVNRAKKPDDKVTGAGSSDGLAAANALADQAATTLAWNGSTSANLAQRPLGNLDSKASGPFRGGDARGFSFAATPPATEGVTNLAWLNRLSGSTSTPGAMLSYSVNAVGGPSPLFGGLNGTATPAAGGARYGEVPGAAATLAPTLAPPPATTPEPPRTVTLARANYAFVQATNAVAYGRFANVAAQKQALSAPRADNYALAKTTKALPQPLASTFDVQQDGPRIRIIDADGSVYHGLVQTTAQSAQLRAVDESKFKSADETAMAGEPKAQITFLVSGTNRTIRKLVVINGSLTPGTATPAKAEQSENARFYRAPQPPTVPAPSSPTAQTLAIDAQDRSSGFVPGNFDATIRVDRAVETHVQAVRVSR